MRASLLLSTGWEGLALKANAATTAEQARQSAAAISHGAPRRAGLAGQAMAFAGFHLHWQPHNALPRAWHGTGGLSDAIVIRLAHAHHFTVSNCDWILRAYEQWQDVPDRCVEQELGRTHRLGLLGWSEISDNVTPAHSDLDLAVYQRIGLSDVHLTRTPLKRTTNER